MRWLAIGTIAFASILIVVLGLRISELDGRLVETRRRLSLPHPGYSVPTFETSDLQGEPVTIGETIEGGKQIILVFGTDCPFIRASLPAWKRLAALVDTFETYPVDLHAISLGTEDETRAYAAENGLSMSVVRFPEPKLAQLYRAAVIPQTLVLDSRGGVLHARTGVLDVGPALDSIVELLSRRMPSAGAGTQTIPPRRHP